MFSLYSELTIEYASDRHLVRSRHFLLGPGWAYAFIICLKLNHYFVSINNGIRVIDRKGYAL